jgi:hypothetical protein
MSHLSKSNPGKNILANNFLKNIRVLPTRGQVLPTRGQVLPIIIRAHPCNILITNTIFPGYDQNEVILINTAKIHLSHYSIMTDQVSMRAQHFTKKQ